MAESNPLLRHLHENMAKFFELPFKTAGTAMPRSSTELFEAAPESLFPDAPTVLLTKSHPCAVCKPALPTAADSRAAESDPSQETP